MTKYNGTITQMLMIYDCFHNGFYAVIFPVQTVNIPLNTVITCFPCSLNQRIIIITIRWAKQIHVNSCKFFNLLMRFHNLFYGLFFGKLRHMFMVFTMISQIMSCCCNCFYIIRVFFYPATGHKKGNFNIILIKDF